MSKRGERIVRLAVIFFAAAWLVIAIVVFWATWRVGGGA